MACDITTGRLLGCRDQVGGVKAIYALALEDVPLLTVDADDQITDFGSTTVLYKYTLQNGTASFEEVITASLENGTVFYQQNLEINLFALTKEDRKEIQLMARNTLAIVVEDYNGNLRFAGLEGGMTINGGASKTGKVTGDMSGYTLTFTAAEKNMAKFFIPYTTTPFDTLTSGTVATDSSNIVTVTIS